MPLPALREPDGRLKRLRGHVLGWLAVLFLFPTLMLGNAFQTLSVVLLPFSRRAFRAVNRFIANTWWGLCVSVARGFHGVRVELTGDELPPDENVIVVPNHQSMADITVLFDPAADRGRLGDLKWYVKDVLKYVPGVGWGMLFLDCLFIKRNWTADRDQIEAVFRRIREDRVPVWVVSFVEGTRVKPHKVESSQKFAAERGLPRLQNVLLPRTKGFVATVEGLAGHLEAVYDLTIGYEEGVPTLWQWIRGLVGRVHVRARRYPVAELPDGEEALTAWLVDRFAEKDRALDRLYRTGSFEE